MANNLPQGWVECELKDVVKYKKGKKPKKLYLEFNENLLPYVDIKCFEKNITESYAEKNDGVVIDANNVLVVWDGARAGFCGSYKDKGILGSTIMSISPILINKMFFEFFIKSKFDILNKNTKGTGIPHVKPDLFWSLKFNLPPLNEQKRIVEKIEEEFAKIDQGIEKLKLAQEQIVQYKQSVLNQQFKKNISKLVFLKDVTSKINDGTHKTPKYTDSGIPFISVKDIKCKQIYFDNCKYISNEEHEILYKRCNPQRGDVLITKSGTIGRTAIIKTDIIFDLFVSVALLKPNFNKITPDFLMYSLDNYINHIDVKQDVKGGVIKNLHIEDLKKIEINLPTLDEQKQIVKEIEKRFEVADKAEKVIAENLEKAQQLKQSILKKAFEGRLVPQDPNDEPASVLLEKIKAERGK